MLSGSETRTNIKKTVAHNVLLYATLHVNRTWHFQNTILLFTSHPKGEWYTWFVSLTLQTFLSWGLYPVSQN